MLPKDKRLKSEEVRRVRRLGARHSHPLFVWYCIESDRFAAAVVVSKKVASRATERNQLRRRAYAALAALDLDGGHYVVVLSNTAKEASYYELREALSLLRG